MHDKLIWQGYTVRSRMFSSDVLPMSKAQHVAQCGNRALGLMGTLQLKFCPECNAWVQWLKEDYQKGLFE